MQAERLARVGYFLSVCRLGCHLSVSAYAYDVMGVKEKVCARLLKWKWLLPQLSYRGRVLVANHLDTLTLWQTHRGDTT